MTYKLVALDLDGTLLNDEKKLPKENIEVLKELHDKGIEIVIATGRRYWSAKEYAEEIGLDTVIMANNGTIIRQMSNDKLLVSKYMDEDDFYNLIKEGRELGLYPILHVDHYHEGYDMIIELDRGDTNYSSYLSNVLVRFKQMEDVLNYKEPKILSVIYIGQTESLEALNKLLIDKYKGKYNSHIMSNMTKVGPMLEVMSPLGSKWDSLKDYAQNKGIPIEEIIAIGDDNNDIEMIKNSGLGIGMKNSSDKVKEVAKVITNKTNNEGGVAEILREIFKL